MSTLKNVFTPKSTKNSSSKNAQFYNKEKSMLISDLASHSDANVRRAVAESPRIPTSILTQMLKSESDPVVLRTVLLNDKLPRKAVVRFLNENDYRVDWFDNDEGLIEHFRQTMKS